MGDKHTALMELKNRHAFLKTLSYMKDFQVKFYTAHPSFWPLCLESEFENWCKENNLPTIFELRGIAPNATRDKTSEQFVRDNREEKEQQHD